MNVLPALSDTPLFPVPGLVLPVLQELSRTWRGAPCAVPVQRGTSLTRDPPPVMSVPNDGKEEREEEVRVGGRGRGGGEEEEEELLLLFLLPLSLLLLLLLLLLLCRFVLLLLKLYA